MTTPSFAERAVAEFENKFKHIGKCSEQKFDAECFCGLDEEKDFLLAKLAEAEQLGYEKGIKTIDLKRTESDYKRGFNDGKKELARHLTTPS